MYKEKQISYRILVLGTPGSGKSTLTRKLSQMLKIEAIHLDKYFWQSDWIETPLDEWEKKVDKLVHRESWVMDGNYINSLSERIKYATHFVYIDIPWYKSIYRIISRMIQYRNKTRPDMNIKCKERPDFEFVKFLLGAIKFNFRDKKNLMNILIGKKYEVLKNAQSIDKWIDNDFQSKPATDK